jgi:hypothetical protein
MASLAARSDAGASDRIVLRCPWGRLHPHAHRQSHI